jgi:hypothetical protein
MSTKVSALTAATNAELADTSLAYVVIDPSGTPASKKSTLAQVGGLPKSWVDEVNAISPFTSTTGGSYTVGIAFLPARSGQSCVGVRFYWPEAATRTVRCSLFAIGGGAALKTADVTTSGSAGYFSATFTGESLTAGTAYLVGIWETSGTVYQAGKATTAVAIMGEYVPTTGPRRYRDFIVVGQGGYAAGDTAPTNNHAFFYAAEPLVSG